MKKRKNRVWWKTERGRKRRADGARRREQCM